MRAYRAQHRRRTIDWFDRSAPVRAAWREKNRYYYAELERIARQTIPPGSRVLELGCGIGDLLAGVQPRLGVGIDVSEAMVRVARRRHDASHAGSVPSGSLRDGSNPTNRLLFLRADAEDLPFETTFDYVICSDLLGHVEDIQALLDAIRAVCCPHTRVLITYYNFLWYSALWLGERLGLKMPQYEQNWLGMQDVDNLLDLAGYRTIQRDASLLLPRHVPVLSPLLNRLMVHLPGMNHLALVSYWVVQPQPRPAADRLSCSVIVPCRNEVGNIAACIERMPALGSHTEVIFVDGASTDGTRERILDQIDRYRGVRDIKLLDQVPRTDEAPPPETAPFAATTGVGARGATNGAVPVEALHVRARHSRVRPLAAEARPLDGERPSSGGAVRMLRLGKGDAVRKGFAAASGDVLFILDADLTVPPEDLPKFLEPIASGKAGFVNGTRLVYPLEDEAMKPVNLLGNKFFSVLFTWLLEQRIKDTLCGTKVLRKTDYEALAANRSYFGDFDPFGDFDLLFGAARLGLHIVEVPVRYRRRTSGHSKVETFKHGVLLLKMSAIAFRRLKLARWLGTAQPPVLPSPAPDAGV